MVPFFCYKILIIYCSSFCTHFPKLSPGRPLPKTFWRIVSGNISVAVLFNLGHGDSDRYYNMFNIHY